MNKIHLVCSEGGIKCLSYLGAVQKLIAEKYEVSSVTTCSAGILIGSMISAGISMASIESKILDFNYSQLYSRKPFSFFSFFKYPYSKSYTPDFKGITETLLGKDFELGELKIPIFTVALDIREKRFLVFSSNTHPKMKISKLIEIAIAVPPFYRPYHSGRRVIVDGVVATSSPIWIAASLPENYPIVVLKTSQNASVHYKKNILEFLQYLLKATVESYDYYAIKQSHRAILVEINCGDIKADYLKIKKEEIERLIIQGGKAMDLKLEEYNNNLHKILEIEDLKNSITQLNKSNPLEKAEILASRMIDRFQNEMGKKNTVFISYSKNNVSWLNRFQVSFKAMEKFAGIKIWDDTSILAGKDRREEIAAVLKNTKIAIFLVTPDFLTSKFMLESELNYFMDIFNKQDIPVIWIAVIHSLYELTPLKNIQCINNPEYPLASQTSSEQDESIYEICKKITVLMKS